MGHARALSNSDGIRIQTINTPSTPTPIRYGAPMLRHGRARWLPVVAVVLIAGVLLFGYARSPGRPTGTALMAGKDPGAIAVDPATHHVFVLNYGDGTVSMIDPRQTPDVRPLSVGGDTNPVGYDLATSRETGRVFVACYDALAVLDASTGALVRTTRVGRIPTALAVDARTSRVLVAKMLEGTVSVLDARTGVPVRVGRRPWALAVAAAAGRACVANVDDDTVSVLDARSGRVLRTVPTGIGPTVMAVDESLARVYVVNKLAYRPPPPAAHQGEWARLLQFLPFVSHAATEGSGSIPGSVSIVSVGR